MFLTWTKHSCKSAQHFFKGDDDILLNLWCPILSLKIF